VPVIAHTALAARGAEPWRLLRLARRFPSVSFVMAHLGSDGGLLQSLSAVDIAAQAPNILVEGSGTVTDPYATYLGPAKALGPDRVLVGSGEPIHQIALSLLKLDLLPMPDDWRRAITGANLARLLGREPSITRPEGAAA
jgi:predicted TIM-barrel fold metal-dependent hydrolase